MPNTPTEQNIVDFSPYTLLRNFSKNRVLPGILAAVIVHVVVIGGLSYEFIYTTWIDPSANAEKVTDADGAKDAANEDKGKPSETNSADAAVAEDDSAKAAAGKDGAKGTKASDDTRLDAPVVRDITDKADPDEIPDKPDDFGISIDDTNP